jgi:hypothetical protein
MKFADLDKINALNALLRLLKGLQRKHDYPRWHVRISCKGSGWENEATIEDAEFMKAFDAFIKEQQQKTVKRIEALGVKDAA